MKMAPDFSVQRARQMYSREDEEEGGEKKKYICSRKKLLEKHLQNGSSVNEALPVK